ncbi:MAG: RibD family protein [Fimbriimonadaceae bacterium]|nr:RibD family protein [Fimbriimonadaceae bacterium]
MSIPYADLAYPPCPAGRPYVAVNMATTIDGKILTGERDEPVADLGSAVDRATMRRIEASVQAVMIGAGTLRATPGLWYPTDLWRIVVSGSGRVDGGSRFFGDAPDRAILLTGSKNLPALPPGVRVWSADLADALARLRVDLGIERLLVEGGSELNAQLLAADLVDELFLTLAPKVKLGSLVPTYAGGDPLPRHRVQRYRLLEATVVEDEVFLRYRRVRPSPGGPSPA